MMCERGKGKAEVLGIFLICFGSFWSLALYGGGKEDMELKEAFRRDFYIGAAVSPGTMASDDGIIRREFSGLTPENIMKPGPIHPREDRYDFGDADRFVAYARENGLLVHGHTLVWHNQTGAWLFRDGSGLASAELLDQRLREHITTVVSRYKGRIAYWDVVNEAISDGSGLYRADSPWFEIMGSDYIGKAFRYAHEADPEARLYYNDYNAVDPGKRERIYRMASDLLEQGVPLHGIGIQGHWSLEWPPVEDIEAAIDRYASLGLEVQITELDVSVYEFAQKDALYTEPTEELMKRQARRYGELYALFARKGDVLAGVTTWGIGDDHTWLDNFPVKNRKNWPLLFDEEGEPKPAYYAALGGAKERK